MKSETERRRWHVTKAFPRSCASLGLLGEALLVTTLGPLALGLLFAAYSPPAHAADVIVVGTPGVDGAVATPQGSIITRISRIQVTSLC